MGSFGFGGGVWVAVVGRPVPSFQEASVARVGRTHGPGDAVGASRGDRRGRDVGAAAGRRWRTPGVAGEPRPSGDVPARSSSADLTKGGARRTPRGRRSREGGPRRRRRNARRPAAGRRGRGGIAARLDRRDRRERHGARGVGGRRAAADGRSRGDVDVVSDSTLMWPIPGRGFTDAAFGRIGAASRPPPRPDRRASRRRATNDAPARHAREGLAPRARG